MISASESGLVSKICLIESYDSSLLKEVAEVVLGIAERGRYPIGLNNTC